MGLFCCFTAPRQAKARLSETRDKVALPPLPPPARLHRPRTPLNPVHPVSAGTSPTELLSLQAYRAAIAPVEAPDLGELVVEDSDGDHELGSQNENTSTLRRVKTRMRGHPPRGTPPRRKSGSSVGSSPAEIERRAELRRLMHKRIQEELRNDERHGASQSDISSGRRQPESPVAASFPGGGPRNNIEFHIGSATQDTLCASGSRPERSISQPTLALTEFGKRREHPSACPESYHRRGSDNSVQERGTLPQVPSSPRFSPKRCPSGSLRSRRHSYSGSQVEKHLEHVQEENPSADADILGDAAASLAPETPKRFRHSLSRAHSSPACHGSPATTKSHNVEESPLSDSLLGRRLGSASPSPGRESDQGSEHGAIVQQAEVVYLRKWRSVQNAALPETDTRCPGIVHLYDMDIHRQLAKVPNSPGDCPTLSRSRSRNKGSGSGRQQSSDSDFARQPESADVNAEGNLPEARNTKQSSDDTSANASSVYPSVPVTPYPSPGPSVLDLSASITNQRPPSGFSLPNLTGFEPSSNPHVPSRIERTSQQTACRNQPNRSGTKDMSAETRVNSLAPSLDTTRGYGSETHADTVEKSIGYYHRNHGTPALFVQTFRKEANRSRQAADSRKPSFLSKLHLSIPKRGKSASQSFDGPGAKEQPLSPMPRNTSCPLPIMSEAGRPSSSRNVTPALSRWKASGSEACRRPLHERAVGAELSDCEHDRPGRRSSLPADLQIKHRRFTADSGRDSGSSRHGSIYSTGRLYARRSSAPGPSVTSVTHRIRGAATSPEFSESPRSGGRYTPYGYPRRRGCDSLVAPEVSTSLAEPVDDMSGPSTSQTQQIAKHGPQPLSVEFGRAVKSSLGKLVPSRSFSSRNISPSGRGGQTGGDPSGDVVRPKPRVMSAAHLNSSVQGSQRFKDSQQPSYPMVSQDVVPSSSRIPSGTKTATVLQTDGPSDVESGHQPTSRSVQTPQGYSSDTPRRGESTATDILVAPLSSPYTTNGTSLLHADRQCKPPSRAMQVPADAFAERADDTISVKSDNVLFKILRLTVSPSLNSVDSVKRKFKTWSGRCRTRPSLKENLGFVGMGEDALVLK
ncbi:hypothetical protein VTK56DRAFT_9897 [Thermocarpiscus australiensis]